MLSSITFKKSCVAALIAAQILMPLRAIADISQLPPMVKPNVPPNIMFTLDDSGSMLFEYMPDDLVPGISYMVGFPAPIGVYKGNSSVVANAVVMGFGDGSGQNAMSIKVARFRSPDVNQIYYDPAVKYEPWKNADGTSMAQANPTAARFNPVAPSDGVLVTTINLTTNAQSGVWGEKDWLNRTNNGTTTEARNFYPATYFKYIGGAGCGSPTTATSTSCFSRVEIKPANAPFPKMSSDRTECAAGGCTYDQEMQNFANWFQYWRSRLLMARGGVGTAFSKQASNLRVGFAAINAADNNINGVNTDIIVSGVSNNFSGTNRSNFFNQLYRYPVTSKGTPLRYAMDVVGQYFQRTDIGGPWQNTINSGSASTDQASCRQNYHIMMTDGTWNGSGASGGAAANVDGTNGSTMTAADGRTYRYRTTGSDYSGPSGSYTVNERQYADNNSDTLADVAMYYWVNDLRPLWPTSKKNVPTNASDPAFWQHLVTYTVGLGVVGTLDPEVDLPALKAGTKSWSTPSANNINNVDDLWHAAVNGHGQYFSAQNPRQFAEGLTKSLQDIASRVGSAAAVATSNNTLGANVKLYTSSYRTDNWSGKLEQKAIDQNTGAVASTNDWDTDNWTVNASTRRVFTYDTVGASGIEFRYANLRPTEQTVFTNATASFSPVVVTGTDIVDYLRGDRSREGNPFRVRNYMLGDLVNSDPQYVKEGKDAGYVFLPTGSYGKSSYQSFLNWKKDPSRAATVYVGSNDGMLHAFDAAATDTAALERFAYVPKTIIPNLPDLASKTYSHRFYVDATVQVADAAIGSDSANPWKMVLVSGVGAGGKAVFALDVTDPTTFSASNVLWEINSSTTGYSDLGYTIGVPQIGRLRDGRWVAVFGNGYGSSSGKAVLYVADLTNGNMLMTIDTGTTSNGMSTPKLVLDSASTIKTVYAGDIKGNMWKINFDTNPPANTTASIAFSGSPLFFATNATDGSGIRQPITTQPQIYPHPDNGVIVVFGTGKIYEDTDAGNVDTQSLYGIWDKSVSPTTVSKTTLVQQVLSKNGSYYSIPNPVAVDWTTKRGWYITLNVTSGERLVTDPGIFEDQVLFTTLVPGVSTDPCVTDGLSTTLQLSPINGGPLSYKTFDTNGDGTISASDTMVSGKQAAATMGTTVIRMGNRDLKIYQAASRDNAINSSPSRASDPIPTVRLWRQIGGPRN